MRAPKFSHNISAPTSVLCPETGRALEEGSKAECNKEQLESTVAGDMRNAVTKDRKQTATRCQLVEEASQEAIDVSLPTLLLDSEVIYSRTAAEAISNIIRQRSTSEVVCAFGGPVPLEVPFYKSYLRDTLACLKRSDGPKFSVVSYIPQNEGATSFAWLELCRRLSIRYSGRFAFAAFAIPEGQLRPFSFQIFDQTTVHLGLRSYSMQSGTPTLSAAIMIRNKSIAERFYGEFVENYRKIGAATEKEIGLIASGLQGLSVSTKRECMSQVEELLG